MARLGFDAQAVTLRANPATEAGRKGIAWVYRHGRVVRHTDSRGRAVLEAEIPRRELGALRQALAGNPDARLVRGHA
jgi:hypothetical protein